MKKRLLLILCSLMLAGPFIVRAADTKAKNIIRRDDMLDNEFHDFLDNEYLGSFILSDRTLGMIATINGNSFYVKRIKDADNFCLKIIDMDTGQQLTTLPYFRMDQFSLDPTGNYYVIELGNGEVIEIPIWMSAADIAQVLANYSGVPIYYGDQIIGVTLFLTDSIQLSLFNPFYGLYNVQFKNLTDKIFENMKLDLFFDSGAGLIFEKKKEKNEKEEKKE